MDTTGPTPAARRHDDRAIFTASAKAQQAADFLRDFSEEAIDEVE
jgi:antirestriction protein ArdC